MNIRTERFTVAKRYPLTISRGTSAGSENLLVMVEHDGVTGWGEMAPTSGGATPESAQSALAALERWTSRLANLFPWQMQHIENMLDVQDSERAAYCALDLALHDWQGKTLGLPIWKLLGLDIRHDPKINITPGLPQTSVTIGINPPNVIRERMPEILERTTPYALKVKLGNPAGIEADKASFIAAQESANAYLQASGQNPVVWRVDANGGWNLDDARAMFVWLAERGVEFVEQPLLRGHEADLAALHHDAPLPLYLDETIRTSRDIPAVAGVIDGVNLKLMKCGGLREAIRIIHTARAHNLKVMIGCMSETSLAITGAAHLGPLVDTLDLDSHLNLAPDPFIGAAYHHGQIVPPDAPGLGVTRRQA